jgi:hypothetical protein
VEGLEPPTTMRSIEEKRELGRREEKRERKKKDA